MGPVVASLGTSTQTRVPSSSAVRLAPAQALCTGVSELAKTIVAPCSATPVTLTRVGVNPSAPAKPTRGANEISAARAGVGS